MKIKNRRALSFDDVILEPGYSDISSRKLVNISSVVKNVRLELPVITAPMTTVVGADMAKAVVAAGGMAILHRYCSVEQVASEFRPFIGTNKSVGVAIGTTNEPSMVAGIPDRVTTLFGMGCRIFCIDVAHGHHSSVRELIVALKKYYGDTIHVMAGNVATAEAFHDLQNWGADSVLIGIGSGSICSTRIQTGHGLPVLQSVIDIQESFRWWKPKKAALISDGGCKNAGDAVKALAAGADAVMMGSLLAGTVEAPGNVVTIDGQKMKSYAGMAAKETQVAWRGYASSDEGVAHMIPFKGSVLGILDGLANNIRSGLSYTGAHNIPEFHKKAVFRIQTSAAHVEGNPHIKSR